MSVATKFYAGQGDLALAQAISARRQGDLETAQSFATVARQQAELCRGAALTTSSDDMDDVVKAEAVAAEAEDYAQPATGDRSSPRRYVPGAWRVPGAPVRPSRGRGVSPAEVHEAKAALDAAMRRLAGLGAAR